MFFLWDLRVEILTAVNQLEPDDVHWKLHGDVFFLFLSLVTPKFFIAFKPAEYSFTFAFSDERWLFYLRLFHRLLRNIYFSLQHTRKKTEGKKFEIINKQPQIYITAKKNNVRCIGSAVIHGYFWTNDLWMSHLRVKKGNCVRFKRTWLDTTNSINILLLTFPVWSLHNKKEFHKFYGVIKSSFDFLNIIRCESTNDFRSQTIFNNFIFFLDLFAINQKLNWRWFYWIPKSNAKFFFQLRLESEWCASWRGKWDIF